MLWPAKLAGGGVAEWFGNVSSAVAYVVVCGVGMFKEDETEAVTGG